MANTGMRREEGIGLAIAVALHAAVLAVLLINPDQQEVVKPPQRIEVTISNEVGMTSTSPDPFSEAAPDQGPELGEAAPAPAPEPAPVQESAPAPSAQPPEPQPPKAEPPKPKPPEPKPRAVEKPQPRPVAKPAPKPAPKPVAKPKPKPSSKPKPAEKAPPESSSQRKSSAIDKIVAQPKKSTPSPKTSSSSAAKSTSSSTASSSSAGKSSTPPKKAGASSFADAFGEGQPNAKSTAGAGAPAAAIGPKQVSALVGAINRQLKPHWQAPQGADADLLITRLRFRLNRDGSLAGEPQVLSTTGETAANRAQVQRHQEQAARAVKLAAPFNLPEDLYEGWKVVTTNFDRRLSQ